MLLESDAIDTGKATDAAPKGSVRLSARLIDRRTRAWKRRCELVAQYRAALGHVDAVTADRIETAAELAVIAELSRAKFLADTGDISLEDVIRVENRAARAERALALPKRAANAGQPVADAAGSRILSILRRERGGDT